MKPLIVLTLLLTLTALAPPTPLATVISTGEPAVERAPEYLERFDGPVQRGVWLPLASSEVEVRSSNPPVIYFAADSKLAEVGVQEVLDEPGEYAVGFRWDYQRATLAAIQDLDVAYPRAEKLSRKWSWPDQTLYEIGRPALALLDDARTGQRRLANHLHQDILHLVARAALGRLDRAANGSWNGAGRALLLLAGREFASISEQGARFASSVELISRLKQDHEANQLKARAAIAALGPGWPLDLEDPTTWTTPERTLIGELGISSLFELELVAATAPAFAPKVDWMAREISRRHARELVDRLVSSEPARSQALAEGPSFDDTAIIAFCTEALKAELETREREAALAEPARAAALVEAMDIVRGAMKSMAQGREAVQQYLKAVSSCLSSGAPTVALREELLKQQRWDRTLEGSPSLLAALAAARRSAAAREAKLSWLSAMIRQRETDPAQGFQAALGYNPANTGIAYDAQRRKESVSAAVELTVVQGRSGVPLGLSPGRSYEFSYRVKTVNTGPGRRNSLGHQSAWLEIIPLDAAGRLMPENALDASIPRSLSGQSGAAARSPAHTSTEEGEGGWLTVRTTIEQVPARVAGFTLRPVLSSVLGEGAVYFDDLTLIRISEGIDDGFEAGTATEGGVTGWGRLLDRERLMLPYSRLALDDQIVFRGMRSLRVEPRGFNVALACTRAMPLMPDRDYEFEAALRCESMEGMTARFELQLVDREGKPLNLVGTSSTLYTPARSDTRGWRLDRLRLPDIRALGGAAQVRVCLRVEGAEPSHRARVWLDDVRLKESPQVIVLCAQSENSGSGTEVITRRDHWRWQVRGLPAGQTFRFELSFTDSLRGGEFAPPVTGQGTCNKGGVMDLPPEVRFARDGVVQVSLRLFDSSGRARLEHGARFLVQDGRREAPVGSGLSLSHLPSPDAWRMLRLASGSWVALEVGPEPDPAKARFMEGLGHSSTLLAWSLPKREAFALSGAAWNEQIPATLERWRDKTRTWQLGPMLGARWHDAAANAAAGFDLARSRAAGAGIPRTTLVLPLEVGRDLRPALASFQGRWEDAVEQAGKALTADEVAGLKALKPGVLLLRRGEAFNFVVNADLSPDEMQARLEPLAARLSWMEEALGGGPEAVRANAQQLLAGGAYALGKLASLQFVTLVPREGTPLEVAADLAEKRARLAWLGFGQVLIHSPVDLAGDGAGLVDINGDPLPSLAAWIHAARLFQGARRSLLSLPQWPAEHFLFEAEDGSLLAALMGGTQRGNLALGARVTLPDLAGNALPATLDADGNLAIEAAANMRLVAGIDPLLLQTLASIVHEGQSLRAESVEQEVTLQLRNFYPGRLHVSVDALLNLPYGLNAAQARLRNREGSLCPMNADVFSLGSAEVGAGEILRFSFKLRPMNDMPLDRALLPLRVTLRREGTRVACRHDCPLSVKADIKLNEVTLTPAGPSHDHADLSASIVNDSGQSRSLILDVLDEGSSFSRRSRHEVEAGAARIARFTINEADLNALEGRWLRLCLSESPGQRFFCVRRRVVKTEGGWTLEAP